MATGIEKAKEATALLQQVNVSDIFSSLALSIADAQKKLDDNSVAQALKMNEQQIAGKSLLEHGFVPAFYSFTQADISASLNLKLAVKESLSVGVKFDLNYAKGKNYSEEELEKLDANAYDKKTEQYKSSEALVMKASEKNSVSIEGESYTMNQSEGAYTMINTFKDDVSKNTSIAEVQHEVISKEITKNESFGYDVWQESGYIVAQQSIDYNATTIESVASVKITNYPIASSAITIATGITFDTGGANDTFTKVLTDVKTKAAAGKVFGISKNGKLHFHDGSGWVIKDSTLFFYHDNVVNASTRQRRGAEIVYSKDVGEGKINVATDHELIHKALRFLYKANANAEQVKFTITGYTDTSGDSKGNDKLGFRRAQALKKHIFGDKASVGIDTVSKGEGDSGSDNIINVLNRKATIELDADYIIIIGGALVINNVSPVVTSSLSNKFVYVHEHTSIANSLKFEFNGSNCTASGDQTVIDQYLQSKSSEFYYESKENKSYLLHQEASLKFYLFSDEKSKINVDYADSKSSDSNNQKTSYLNRETGSEERRLAEREADAAGDSKLAMTGSVDFRMSKQFEMSMEGNASMSAKLVATPPPPGFITELKKLNE
jgi:hypothetical protein